jgi:hypothetical protein
LVKGTPDAATLPAGAASGAPKIHAMPNDSEAEVEFHYDQSKPCLAETFAETT